jgi:hypothetical protein
MSTISISGTSPSLQPIIDEINILYFNKAMKSLCRGYEIRFGHRHIIPCAMENLSKISQDFFVKNGYTFDNVRVGIQVDATLQRIKQATNNIPGKKLVIEPYDYFGDPRYAIRLERI